MIRSYYYGDRGMEIWAEDGGRQPASARSSDFGITDCKCIHSGPGLTF